MNNQQDPNLTHIVRTVQLLRQRLPNSVIEYRALGSKNRGVISGYFRNDFALAKEALRFEREVEGSYVTLNPVNSDLLIAPTNTAKEHVKRTTSDSDISHLLWLLVDFDPIRPSGISSNDDEHNAALKMARDCRKYLEGCGWSDPIFADSGNGAHLLYPVDLPNTQAEKQLLGQCLKALSFLFTSDRVEVDTTTSNPARISKLYGTLARKGTATTDTPHRRSKIIEANDEQKPVSRACLEDLAARYPHNNFEKAKCSGSDKFDLDKWILKNNLPVAFSSEWQGGRKWILSSCPWNSSHTNRSTYIVQFANGAIAAGCHHNGCSGRGWHDLRQKYEPGWSPEKSNRVATPKGAKDDDEVTTNPRSGRNDAIAIKLLEIAKEAQLFHTPEEEAYAAFNNKGHIEIAPVKGQLFIEWLSRRYYESENKPPQKQILTDVLDTLVFKARYDGATRSVHTRIAEHEGHLYVNLANSSGQVVKVSDCGYTIEETSPVAFRKLSSVSALVTPQEGGSIDDLKLLINIGDEDDFTLVVGWLLGTFMPRGPYPVLVVNGEQGSAKSSMARTLKSIVDAPGLLRSASRNEHDFILSALNGWILALDNLSDIPQWFSDALCRLSTGAAFGTRALYKDDEEKVFQAQRPIIITSIEELVEKGDLLDRAISIRLPRVKPENRRSETELRELEARLFPGILGALLKAVSVAHKNFSSSRLKESTRMADFAQWMTAAEVGLGWKAGRFMRAYNHNREKSSAIPLESSVLYEPLLLLGKDTDKWEGTSPELLSRLTEKVSLRRPNGWPNSGGALTRMLDRLSPSLSSIGISVYRTRKNDKRIIEISFEKCVTGVTNHYDEPESDADSKPAFVCGDTSDANDTTLEPFYNQAADFGDISNAE